MPSPQDTKLRTTWSPGCTFVPAGPTEATTPAPSWPSTAGSGTGYHWSRSEEHTSELQSRPHLLCRPLLEKNHLPQAGRRPGRTVTDTRALALRPPVHHAKNGPVLLP